MEEFRWYYPNSIEEAVGLLELQGVVPHGGGTGIIRGKLDRYKGLISLEGLGLDYIKEVDGVVEIGATATYHDVIEFCSALYGECILAKSLSRAASTPLRNRITIGGSVAYFPIWSDLMGPLIALDATVSLVGKNEGEYPVKEFARNRSLKSHSLIKSVKFKRFNGFTYYHRAARTHFDYGSFNITMLASFDNGVFSDVRLVLVGSKAKFQRLTEIENGLIGRSPSDIDVSELIGRIYDSVEFHNTRIGSAEYTRSVALVEIERAVHASFKAMEGEK